MRLSRVGRWCVLCVVVAGATASLAAEPDAEPSKSSVPNKKIVPILPDNSRELAARRDREKANWLRRLDVCFELQRIAQETGDAELERRAEELEARACEIYKQRLAGLQPSAPQPTAAQRLTEKPPTPPREHHSTAPWARASKGSGSHDDEEDDR